MFTGQFAKHFSRADGWQSNRLAKQVE
jgi:hypothetical protein